MSVNNLKPGQLKILKAVAVLLEDSSGKITIARIAKQVHVTDAAIYRHYHSKEEIFQALMGYMEANLLTPLNAAQQEKNMTTSNRLQNVFSQYMDFLMGHPGLARLFLGHSTAEATGLSERIKMMHAKVRAQLAQILRHGEAESHLAKGVTPEQGTELFYGLVIAAAMAQVFDFPQISLNHRWALFAHTVLNEPLALTDESHNS